MDIELDLEAKTYSQSIHKNPSLRLFREYSTQDFISGATSKWVEKQKLEFAIEQLKKLKEDEVYDKIKYVESSIIDYELMKLEQKLSELV